jgi:hypothetical protein
MAKNEQTSVAKLHNPHAIRTLEGIFDDIGKDSVTFRYKKPKSKNWESRVIPMKDVEAYSGGVGKQSTILFRDTHVLSKIFKGVMETGTGEFNKLTQDDGSVIYIRTGAYTDIRAEADAPSIAVNKKKTETSGGDAPKKKKK